MDLAPSLESFFHEEVERALREQRVDGGGLTAHYLVQLLAAYAGKTIDQRPLGVELLAAMDAGPAERRSRLREVGDTSLYVSGFWSDSFANSLVDVDYYIGVGGSAYGELARGGMGWTRDPLGDVYGELAHKFTQFVDVLMLVSRRTTRLSPTQDVYQLYDRFKRTKSRWAARRLAAMGILPGDDEKPQ